MLQEKLDEVKAVMLNGEEMKSRCRDDEVLLLTNKLLQLHRQTCSTVTKSNALQVTYTVLLMCTADVLAACQVRLSPVVTACHLKLAT